MLDDKTAAMSERGTADLLGVDQKLLNRMRTNWPPKALESFIDKDLSMRTNLAEVTAANSPYKGRKIGSYRIDFFVKLLDLVLECNGYDYRRYYDPVEERKREQVI